MTLRLLERLSARGHQVEWFSALYPGAVATEMRDGIQFVREGSQATVHLAAYRHYGKHQPFDIVVDEINTIPFFTPIYFRIPKVALMYQLAREVWFHEAPKWLGPVGYFAEPMYMQAYRKVPIATISDSSAQSFKELGLRGPCRIVPIACDEPAVEAPDVKLADHSVIVVARLAPSKRIEHAIQAAAHMRENGWLGTLDVVGSGEDVYVRHLRAYADRVAPGTVTFHGRVSDGDRSMLMRRASVLWMTSEREGWGLVVTEANRNATPAIVYDVPGLRDAVKSGVNGYVVPASPKELALATLRLFNSPSLDASALESSMQYSWDASADAFEEFLQEMVSRYTCDSA